MIGGRDTPNSLLFHTYLKDHITVLSPINWFATKAWCSLVGDGPRSQKRVLSIHRLNKVTRGLF